VPRDLEQLVLLTAGEREFRALLGGLGLFPSDGHSAVADYAALVACGVAGVGVFQNLRVSRAQALCSDHGCDDGAAATGFPGARREVTPQAQVIPLLDGLERLVVDLHRFVVRMIVRQVGADQDERLRAHLGFLRQQRLRERQAQGAAEAVVLVAHHDGDQLELAQRALQKG